MPDNPDRSATQRSSGSKSGQQPRWVGSGWVDELDGHDRPIWARRLIRLVSIVKPT
ncbi:hypothetical protein DEO72_LG11g930 [Vigna unguiculata]|uniref:Uncharacterized protein n=1 Tax=Vigna unguiculata TaxID=3917 RepID=A0A4D6NLL5_VIGUN|nr:hypothetical protein DEO72_LG11g930 [Vigna unguiculata]